MSFDDTLQAGTTSKIIEVMLRDSSTGGGKTSVAHGDVTASYTREAGTRTAITLASGTAGDAYSSGKWAEVDATNCKGLYQLHVPNAAIASGVDTVTLSLQASGVLDKSIRMALLDVDLRDSTRAGLTALPNAAADAAGGLPISDAGGLDLDSLSTFDSTSDTVDIGKVTGTAVTDVTDFHADTSALGTLANQTAIASYIDTEIGTLLTGVAALQVGVTVSAIGTNVITAASIATDAVTEIQNGLSTFDSSSDTVDIGKVTGTAVSDVSDFQADVSSLATAAELTKTVDRSGYCLTILAGTISTAGMASETFDLTIDGVAYRAAITGLDTDGNRSGQTLSKP